MLAFCDDVCAPAPRSERMEQRTTIEAKTLIERAARALGVNASEFITVSATRAARDTLQSYERTTLKPEAHRSFMAAFDATEPTPALLDLMSLHAEVAEPA
ncbi:DUF1778 domain-containing protein [Methylobacterium aquaticum]|uniref:type II toxin-antitoxin system TacA family antitoxin n=1 Tax=Methylobacterium aquaticum TaxID=270351 RepID=UPI003D179965